jgi:hypothetical protein
VVLAVTAKIFRRSLAVQLIMQAQAQAVAVRQQAQQVTAVLQVLQVQPQTTV